MAEGGFLRLERSTVSDNAQRRNGLQTSAEISVAGSAVIRDATVAADPTAPGSPSPRSLALTAVTARMRTGNSILAGGCDVSARDRFNNLLQRARPLSLDHDLVTDASCETLVRPNDLVADPLLVPLAENGGPTATRALPPASPAVDSGGPACGATDQRGAPRPLDGDGDGGSACDRGAFEAGTAPGLVCLDGLDNDADTLVDLADPGCRDLHDGSERDPAIPCDNGLDDDGDGKVDHPADPGCLVPSWFLEDPQCDDGVDNADGDGLADDADPECASRADLSESCGLGPELAVLLPTLAWLGRRRKRAGRRLGRPAGPVREAPSRDPIAIR